MASHQSSANSSTGTGALPAFAAGTMIATLRGEIPVERLRAGDRLLTLDNGYRALLWLAARGAAGEDEVEFPAGSLGAGLPHRPLCVTPCHRLLAAGADLARHFGESEVLATVGHFPDQALMTRRTAEPGRRFLSLLLADHEIILASGVWCESVFAGDRAATPPSAFPALAAGSHLRTARLCLDARQSAQAFGALMAARPRPSAA